MKVKGITQPWHDSSGLGGLDEIQTVVLNVN